MGRLVMPRASGSRWLRCLVVYVCDELCFGCYGWACVSLWLVALLGRCCFLVQCGLGLAGSCPCLRWYRLRLVVALVPPMVARGPRWRPGLRRRRRGLLVTLHEVRACRVLGLGVLTGLGLD